MKRYSEVASDKPQKGVVGSGYVLLVPDETRRSAPKLINHIAICR